MVIVSSELPEVLGLGDRIVVVNSGRISGRFDRAQASEEVLLQAAVAGAQPARAA